MNPKKYILLVDDDPLLTKLYEKTLQAADYDVSAVSSGEMALSEVDKKKPDLIFLDIMMPKMSGIEVLKKIKEDQNNKNIKVIILTNMGRDTEEVRIARELGAEDHLIKSEISLKDLVTRANGATGK